MTTTEWIKTGGVKEDNFPRFLNHFFDPVTEQGIIFLGEQNSSKVWAKDLSSNDWDWASAREYFHTALTSTDMHVRETRLADTFRAVGQVMHLVEDLASPAHVRNDVHMPTIWDKDFYEEYTDKKFRPKDGAITYSGYAPVDLSTFSSFDTFWKNGDKGLSEFTNKNFLSRDTNIDNNAYTSPVPIGEWLAEETPDPDKPPVYVRYQQGYATDAYRPEMSAPISKLASFSYFDFEMKKLYPDKALYTLNDSVHREYAQFLVPRAVGYAAGLLNYFFRGKIDLQVASGTTFRTINVTARNTTANDETMPSGEVSLVIRYKELLESGAGPMRTLNFPPDDEYKYRVVKLASPLEIPSDSSVQLSFDLSADPLPLHIGEVTLQLVYKGKLGNEEGSVAVGSTPLPGLGTNIGIILPASGVFAKTTGSNFTGIDLIAESNIPGALTGGIIELVLEYQLATTDPFASLPVDSEPQNADSYIIRIPERNGVNTLTQGAPVELQFDLSAAPLPLWATDVYMNVVYRRTGDPEANPVAVGYRDISEPTPVDIFNNTDYACISNSWYPAGSPEARAAADLAGNKNGFDDDADTYRHDFKNIYAKASSIGDPVTASPGVFDFFETGPAIPNTLKRMGFILTDYSFKYSFLPNWVHTDPMDRWTRTEAATLNTGSAIRNQTDSDGNYTYPDMYVMREKPMWWGSGIIYNVKFPASSSCDWDSLPSTP